MIISASCRIKAPRTRVFQAFADLESLPQHVRAITGIEMLTPGEVGVGTRFRETRVMFGKEASEIMEVTDFSPPSRLVEEARSSGMHYTSVWSFTEEEGVTTVTIGFTGKAETFMAKVLSLIFSLMAGSMKKAFLTDMDDLKAVIEAEG